MKIWKRDFYEKLLGKEKTVNELQFEVKAIQARIQELQSKCDHPTYEVMFYSWRPGALQPSHVCKTCNKMLGMATEEESKALWDEWHGKRWTEASSALDTSNATNQVVTVKN